MNTIKKQLFDSFDINIWSKVNSLIYRGVQYQIDTKQTQIRSYVMAQFREDLYVE
jgi:hypothetical protein